MSLRLDRTWRQFVVLAGALAFAGLLGCGEESAEKPSSRIVSSNPAKKPAPPPVEGKKVPVGQGVYLEVLPKAKRVLVSSRVCLREGVLEGLLTRKGAMKEHEYILAADIDARHLHTALELAGAKPGAPVQFEPYRAAFGMRIAVSLRYKNGDETVTVPAQEWICDAKKKQLDKEWVFTGSKLLPNDDTGKPPVYLANYGDVICTRNMEDSALDLSLPSALQLEDNRIYQAYTERIPPLDTQVIVILEPVLRKMTR